MFPHTSNASGAFTCLAILQSLVLLLPPSVRDQQEPTVAAEAPPLVWPSWLVHLEGYQLKIQQGTDQAKNDYLRTTFNTHAPMTQIHSFYLNLLKANDYPGVTGGLETGHTISGVLQRIPPSVMATKSRTATICRRRGRAPRPVRKKQPTSLSAAAPYTCKNTISQWFLEKVPLLRDSHGRRGWCTLKVNRCGYKKASTIPA
jgi:hypothetical protein